MNFAIIAAGEGSRLRQEGISAPKPLVCLGGEPLLGRLVRLFASMQAQSISVICNAHSPEVVTYLEQLSCQYPSLRYIVRSTPSSMHSLYALSEIIPPGRFCLTTVDTVFPARQFEAYIQAFGAIPDADGLFAVTPFVDDEKPLWVGVNAENSIVGFYDQVAEKPASVPLLVSGGIYCLDSRSAFPILHRCIEQGQARMRNYQRALISAGLHLKAYVFPKVMDIDHAADLQKAETWLSQSEAEV